MRPDEHKKKKNAQYKKKHGIAGAGQQTNPKAGGKDRKHVEDKTLTTGAQSAQQLEQEKKKDDEKIVTEQKLAEGDSQAGRHKQYRRRQIVSNWSKYEDISDSDEDSATQRGEDFGKLLAEAGGSAAQFRLKDEEDWDVDKQQTSSSLMALDFDLLAESLSCIPLQERLGIQDTLFLNEQKEEMHSAALDNERRYKVKINDGQHKFIDTDYHLPKMASCDDSDTDLPAGLRTSSVKEKANSQTDKVIPQNVETRNSESSSKTSKVVDTCKSVSNNSDKIKILEKVTDSKVNGVVSEDASNLEEDLDLILSLDETSKPKQNIEVPTPEKQSRAEKRKTVDNPSDKVVSSGDKQNKTGTNNNLEDWLDDLLGD